MSGWLCILILSACSQTLLAAVMRLAGKTTGEDYCYSVGLVLQVNLRRAVASPLGFTFASGHGLATLSGPGEASVVSEFWRQGPPHDDCKRKYAIDLPIIIMRCTFIWGASISHSKPATVCWHRRKWQSFADAITTLPNHQRHHRRWVAPSTAIDFPPFVMPAAACTSFHSAGGDACSSCASAVY